MTIIAYTYEAAMHCVGCTQKRLFPVDNGHPHAPGRPGEGDEHGIHLNAIDHEGNLVRPVFEWDEVPHGECCDDCFTQIVE